MRRFDCLKALSGEAKDALVVSSAGATTLEWNALRPGDGNFRVRTLGLCSSIALGMALSLPQRKVIALDGDGSLLMNLCSLPTIARMQPKNCFTSCLTMRCMRPQAVRKPRRQPAPISLASGAPR